MTLMCAWFKVVIKVLYPVSLSCSPTYYSMGGHRMVPSADEHFYCATKYAVTALTEGIRQELREANTHIRATVSLGTFERKDQALRK